MSDFVRPYRRQPTRLPHPWDSPGKNTGMGCRFLFQCMKVKSIKYNHVLNCKNDIQHCFRKRMRKNKTPVILFIWEERWWREWLSHFQKITCILLESIWNTYFCLPEGTLPVSNVRYSYIFFVLGGIIRLSLKVGTEGVLGNTPRNKYFKISKKPMARYCFASPTWGQDK